MRGEILSMETLDKINLLEKQVEAQKEIIKVERKKLERLNNIINELDKLIEQYSKNDYYYKYNGKYLKSEIINDLKIIRGVDKEWIMKNY